MNEKVKEIIEKEKQEELTNKLSSKSIQDSLNTFEQLANMTCGELLFDSDKDDWNQFSSNFNKQILGGKRLTFLIEDTNGEFFGYYLNR